MSGITVKNLGKRYPNGVEAIKNFNVEIKDGEFIVLLGPSGCGKSTMLMMLAGLEEISSGELYIDDVCVNSFTPRERDIGVVFQSYALLPNMNVYDNIGFGLTIHKMPKKEKDLKIRETAKILGLEEYLDRKPKNLSGGQKQRVAIGRCIARDPKVFLFDEPLSNLDAKLRVQTRKELIKLHKMLKATIVYVTHDQVEAMTMANRIIIMKDGEIQQIGTPDEVYKYPANLFVATFIGSPKMNILKVKFCVEDGRGLLVLENGKKVDLNSEMSHVLIAKGAEGKALYMGIRPDMVVPTLNREESHVEGVVKLVEMLGSEKHIYFQYDGMTASSRSSAEATYGIGEPVCFTLDTRNVVLFDLESEARICNTR